MRPWSTRELVTLAVFRALWGVAEMSLGALLHSLRFPLTGMAMSSIGMLVALTGYRFVPRRGAVLTIAVASALLKLLSIGANVFSPMLAIAMEGLLAELGLASGGSRPTRVALALAGALGVLWSFAHRFAYQGLLAGGGVLEVYLNGFAAGARLLGLDPQVVPVALLVLAALHAAAGAVTGLVAHGLGLQVTRRLQSRAA